MTSRKMLDTTPVRQGFTLVELLVVIAIIGVLIALLLPAVQQAREAARRMQCSSNLKQMGLAMHNYMGSHGVFPAGWYGRITSGSKNRVSFGYPGWGWGTMILPMLEQSAVYDAFDMTVSRVNVSNSQPNGQTRLSVYRCPSDVGPDLNANRSDYATSNYFGCFGSLSMAVNAPASYDPDYGVYLNAYSKDRYRGMFGGNSAFSTRDILDGTSNTVMLGETSYGPHGNGEIYNGAIWIGYTQETGYNSNVQALNSGVTFRIHGVSSYAYSSYHPGGAQFVFADGSVHFLSETTDGETINNLADRADQNVVVLP